VLEAADAVMVARGDLGVEMLPEKVPAAQKRIISRAGHFRRPSITATQMLASMTQSPRPTRAEASDVANAVLDGTSAVMLSNETSVGSFPVEAVAMMDRIIREAESVETGGYRGSPPRTASPADAVAEAVAAATRCLPVKLIAAFTQSGTTARLIANERPTAPIIAFSPVPATLRRASLYWGVNALPIRSVRDIDELASEAEKRLRAEALVSKGEVFAIVAGTPLGTRGTTNLLKLHTVAG